MLFIEDVPIETQLERLARRARRYELAGKRTAAAEIWRWILRHTPSEHRGGRWMDEAKGSIPNFAPGLRAAPKTRIYILGCGRSGTWLLLGLMATFDDVYLGVEERHFGHFAAISDRPQSVHVVKRTHYAHAFMQKIPLEIEPLYIIRDPRDVLTSTHYDTEYYISMDRWLAEMASLNAMLASMPGRLTVVQFEDLVRDPGEVQRTIAGRYSLTPIAPAERFNERFKVSDRVSEGIHGVRPLDAGVIGRWQRDDRKRKYLRDHRARIEDTFAPLASAFGYDLSGDW